MPEWNSGGREEVPIATDEGERKGNIFTSYLGNRGCFTDAGQRKNIGTLLLLLFFFQSSLFCFSPLSGQMRLTVQVGSQCWVHTVQQKWEKLALKGSQNKFWWRWERSSASDAFDDGFLMAIASQVSLNQYPKSRHWHPTIVPQVYFIIPI